MVKSSKNKIERKNKLIGFILGSVLWIFILLIVIYSNNSNRESENTYLHNCDKPYINCKIIDTSNKTIGGDCSQNYTDILGKTICEKDTVYYLVVAEKELCGQEEAYYFFENFKGNQNKLGFIMECE